nr:YuiB family protein [Texcoconibacillus texcoconensis]
MISILLFIVLFFGIGFILNMLLRATWVMAFLYPVVVIGIISSTNDISMWSYVFSPFQSFPVLWGVVVNLKTADIIILSSGLVGAILSGITIKMLRNRGYQMF